MRSEANLSVALTATNVADGTIANPQLSALHRLLSVDGWGDPGTEQRYHAWMRVAQEQGFEGFGGHCFVAALALNEVLFENNGRLIGAFNEALYQHQDYIGHLVVAPPEHLGDGPFPWPNVWLDADGFQGWDDVESWGMLDENDEEIRELAKRYGLAWDEEKASTVIMVELSVDEALRMFDLRHEDVARQVETLRQSFEAWGLTEGSERLLSAGAEPDPPPAVRAVGGAS